MRRRIAGVNIALDGVLSGFAMIGAAAARSFPTDPRRALADAARMGGAALDTDGKPLQSVTFSRCGQR